MTEKHTHEGEYEVSEESTSTELIVTRAEGAAYGTALKYLTTMEASDSGEQTTGDYIIAYSIEDAEGLYHMENGQLRWHEPTQENCHIEVAVRNAADGRFLPCLSIRATLHDENGGEVGSYGLPFLWHPWVYHYGRNVIVPRDGRYRLQVHVDAPDFPRHDRVNGHRFHAPADASFDIHIKTGRKSSKAA